MNKKIVWIEDDLGIIRAVVRPLQNAGYQIITFANVPEALKNMEAIRSADIFLVDLIHPTGVDNSQPHFPGLLFIEQLRKEFHINRPIIALTVVTNIEAHRQLEKLKARIENKPILPSKLKAIVEEELGI
jgi:CheY-like chemotaxis protein